MLVFAQALRSMPLLLFGAAIAGIAGGLGYRFGLQVVNELAPQDRRSESVSAYLIVCYAAISLPVVGVGLVAAAASLIVADVIFGVLIALMAIVALVVGARSAAEH